jgi:hypothetical protein
MGAADDIKKGLTKNLANFTKQCKAEEKQSSALRWRRSRMTEVRGEYLTEAANRVMRACYMKASDNNQLPATARQIFYVARPLLEKRTGKPLQYSYFSQTLLPNYITTHRDECRKWDVVYDDRGHFMEPHTERIIGLGTLNVRDYLEQIRSPKLKAASFSSASVETHGPAGCYGAMLYVEKEGFLPLFERVNLAQRYDIAIMSSKGMSVTAARTLVATICSRKGVPLYVLHDFDAAGIIIKDTLENDTRRFRYSHKPNVIDLGLQFDDIDDLDPEDYDCKIGRDRLEQAGVGDAAIDFLMDQRVELNAMTSRQLVDFVERKLNDYGVAKLIPGPDMLADAYRMFVASERLSEKFEELEDEVKEETNRVEVPDDLRAKVEKYLKATREITWHRAVQLIADPDAPEHEDDDDDDDGGEQHEGDENLSEIDE